MNCTRDRIKRAFFLEEQKTVKAIIAEKEAEARKVETEKAKASADKKAKKSEKKTAAASSETKSKETKKTAAKKK